MAPATHVKVQQKRVKNTTLRVDDTHCWQPEKFNNFLYNSADWLSIRWMR